MKNIFLCGFMGCGKSSVGKALSSVLDAPFADLDELIVKHAEMSIPQIFEKYGQAHFRTLETNEIEKISAQNGNIIATGGGAMVNADNARIAKRNGVVVFLDVDFETCYERIAGDTNRPIVQSNTKEQLLELYNTRKAHYEQNCDFKLYATDLTIDQICLKIKQLIF